MRRLLLFAAALSLVACSKQTSSETSVPSPAPTTTTTPANDAGALAPTPGPDAGAPSIDHALLMGSWIHSHEEGDVYRPASYKDPWPPARFRGEFTLQGDGTGSWGVLAPDDGHYAVPIDWKLEGDVLTLTATEDVRFTKKGKAWTLSISSLTSDEMLLSEAAGHHP